MFYKCAVDLRNYIDVFYIDWYIEQCVWLKLIQHLSFYYSNKHYGRLPGKEALKVVSRS